MVNCPVCEIEIPFKKWIFLTNYNSIECPFCSSELAANKRTNSILGAIGGGIGAGVTALLIITFQNSGELIFLLALIPFLLVGFLGFTLISVRLMTLELKRPYQEPHDPPPPLFKID
jgi:hypothetical protein